MPRGRPTKYRKEMCGTVVEVMKQGFSKEAVAGHLGITQDTLYRWIKEKPKFSEAIKEGVEHSRIFWEDIGIQGVLAGSGNATMWIFNMKNRFGWRDKQETEITGKDGEGLTIKIVEDTVRVDGDQPSD